MSNRPHYVLSHDDCRTFPFTLLVEDPASDFEEVAFNGWYEADYESGGASVLDCVYANPAHSSQPVPLPVLRKIEQFLASDMPTYREWKESCRESVLGDTW